MKKNIVLLISCVFLSQAVQAGKYFDANDDGKTIFFKKSGHKFNGALNHLLNHAKSHKIQQVHFHKNISDQQKKGCIATLSQRLNVVDMGNGLLEDASTYKSIKTDLNGKKSLGIIFKNDVALDLREAAPQILKKYLPLAKNIIEGMDQVASLHFTLSGINSEMLGPIKKTLLHNPGIKRIFFHDNEIYDSPCHSNSTKVIPDLLFIPREMKYHFSLHALSKLSIGFLDETFNGVTPEETQNRFGKKTIMSLRGYVGDCYDTSPRMQNYKEVCQSKYGLIFKASYDDYMGEIAQGTLLIEMLQATGEFAVKYQLGRIDEILSMEDNDLPKYFEEFYKLKNILTAQLLSTEKNSDTYLQLEKNKIELIKAVLTRMGQNEVSTQK